MFYPIFTIFAVYKSINMSIITRFLTVVTEPQFKLARDLTAMAIADGEVTNEEKEAISVICHLEGIDERKLREALKNGSGHVEEEIQSGIVITKIPTKHFSLVGTILSLKIRLAFGYLVVNLKIY